MSATSALQGQRVRIVDFEKRRLGASLAEAVEPYLAGMATFADVARPHIFKALMELWTKLFPMVLPPDGSGGPRDYSVELER